MRLLTYAQWDRFEAAVAATKLREAGFAIAATPD